MFRSALAVWDAPQAILARCAGFDGLRDGFWECFGAPGGPCRTYWGVIFGPFWGPQGTESGLRTDFAVIFAQGSASLRFGTASVVIFASKKMFDVRFRSIWEKRFRKK